MQQYKVTWTFKGKKTSERADYVAPSLLEVLRLLNKSEGVNTETTDYVYVHQIFEDGTVIEVFSHDRQQGTTNFKDSSLAGDNVESIVAAQLKKAARESGAKPHVKLQLTRDEEPVRYFVRASYGRFKAYEAQANAEDSD